MNRHELLWKARGLQQTAANVIRAGQGSHPAESIVRDAAQALIRGAMQINGHDPAVQALTLRPEATWSEIFHVSQVLCDFGARSEG